MKSFRHPNVVGLIAMCLDSPDGIPRMVLPYMANGNLKKFLQRSRRFSQNTETCPEVGPYLQSYIYSIGLT